MQVSTARRKWAWALTCAAAMPLLLSLLLGSVYFFATFQPFYEREYEKYDNASVIGVEPETLSEIAGTVIGYMARGRDSLDMRAVIHSEEREVFTDKEKAHMVDVLYLFDLLRIALFICVPLTIAMVVTAALLLPRGRRAYLSSRAMLCSLAVCLLIILAGVAIVASDFNYAFIKFHHIFFTNDLWLLDADSDVLIQMMPTGFFVDIAAAIAAAFLGVSTLIMMGCALNMLVSQRRAPKAAPVPERPSADEIFDSLGINDDSAVPADVQRLLRDEGPEQPPDEPVTKEPKLRDKFVPEGQAPSAQELRDRLERL